jgi:RHS repeat-associated protein
VSVRRVLAILLLAMLAVVMPSSASASITPTPETRIGNFELHEPALLGFVVTRTIENHRAKSILCADVASQHSLRWKGMWRYDVGGVELYDARARMWSPALGSFLSIDEFQFHDGRTTLWGWPGQNPLRYRDPSGHYSSGLVAFIVTNPETIPFAIAAVAAVVIAKDLWDFEHPEITQASGGPGPSSCPSAQPASSASPGAAPQASPAGPRDAGADADAGRPRGVIYLRRDRLGGMKDYVGQAESEARFAERQAEHGRDHPGADFEFFVLENVDPGGLSVAEESWIRAGGGPRRSDGGLGNDRFQMNDGKYRDAGGRVPWP